MKKYLGLDYGEKKIGISISDGIYASELTTVDTAYGMHILPNLIKEHKITTCIVGLPQGYLKQKVNDFADLLKKSSPCEVIFWDETLTTRNAQNLLQNLKRKGRITREHQAAAVLLLQSYLDENKTTYREQTNSH